jgi:phosphoenolpyruvate synthase/pyruvate phosphate dikinase
MAVMLIPLDHAGSDPLRRSDVGSKAAVLAELSAAGFAVPPGFVVTVAGQDDPALAADVTGAARLLGTDRFAVRSSGTAEDLTEASYAGLYETFLNVPADRLDDAVRRCFAAADADRVKAYHRRHGAGGAAMAGARAGHGRSRGRRGRVHRRSADRRSGADVGERGRRARRTSRLR